MPEEEKPKANAPRCYAVERLVVIRSEIIRSSAEMLTERAKVEKYREVDPAKAQESYLKLKTVRKRLLEDLRESQLCLLEVEESALARVAGKISQGLSGFQLMSRSYKPVYEVLIGFVEKLPKDSGTVSAVVLGRLMNSVRMGYYPTDPENVQHLLRGIRFPSGVTTNLLDPCCGCGKALRQIADGNNCYTYGVELDEHRAEEAQSRLHRVGMGSFFHSRMSMEAFHLLFLNPPYLTVLTEGGGKTRNEKRFLAESVRYLMYGGLLVCVIPYYRLTADICRILADNFEDISVWRFTDSEFARFKQVVVLGKRVKRRDGEALAAELERWAVSPESIPIIAEIPPERYALPPVLRTVGTFKGERFNERELERQLTHSASFRRLLEGRRELDRTEKHPLLPLSIGQIGLVGGSGMINGLVDCDTPHIIKGRIVKVRREDRDEKFSTAGEHIGAEVKEVVSNKMVFNVLTPKGFRALT